MPAAQVFFVYNLTHWFIIHFTLYPGNNIEVGKGPGFKPVFFQVFDIMQKFFH